MKTRILVVTAFLVILGANSAWAQMDSTLRISVPFEFIVGSKVLPAGQYDFARVALNNALQVRSTDGGMSADAIVLARLWSGIHTTPVDSHIVFDMVDGRYALAELWIPGADGFLLHITKEPHERKVITVGN